MQDNLHNKQYERGVSIIETTMAIAIMAMLILCAVSLLRGVSNEEEKNRAVSEVEWQSYILTDSISQSIRNASAISSPATSTASTSLNLVLSGIAAETPTVYSWSSSTKAVSVSKANGTASAMTSSRVNITSMTFQNISATSTRGAVRVSFAISYNNPGNRPELTYSSVRNFTITLR